MIRYVTTTGGGDGTSEGNAWSLSTALTSATPGTTVYIKAGTYSMGGGITVTASGTSGNPIKYIGYNSTIGDLDSQSVPKSHYNYGDTFPMPDYPYIQGSSDASGFGLSVSGSYVHFENIQIGRSLIGMIFNGSNNRVENCVFQAFGDQDQAGVSGGQALTVNSDNNEVINCFFLNAGGQSLTFVGNNNLAEDCWTGGDNNVNYSAYQYLCNGNNNIVRNCDIYRYSNDSGHQFHGYIVKNGGQNNLFDGGYAFNTGIEASYKNSRFNTWQNITCEVEPSRASAKSTYAAGIQIFNGSRDNYFINIIVKGNLSGTLLRDYDDGSSSNDNEDAPEGGSDNTFINCVFEDVERMIWFSDGQSNGLSPNDGNRWINCTFRDASVDWLSKSSQMSVTNHDFINCLWDGMAGAVWSNTSDISGVRWINNNIVNSGSVPVATSYQTVTGQSTTSFSFTDPANNDYSITTAALDTGVDPTTYDPLAATDYNGITRTSPYTIGAFEFAGAATLNPAGDVFFTPIMIQNLSDGFANVGGTFPDNTTGYHDDFTEMNARAEEFRTDMAGGGPDRGAFINFHTGINLIPRYTGDAGIGDTEDPFPASWTADGRGPAFSWRNIHAAALKALGTNDATLAGYVLEALHARALDDELDFSNGSLQREGGKPTRTNPTFGTNERYPFGRQETFRAVIGQNPYFMLSGKMEAYLISFLAIYELVKNSTYYINNGDDVTYWFEDYYRFAKNSADIHLDYWLGSNWRSFTQDWERPTNVYSDEVAFSGPSTVLYTTSAAAAQGFTNRSSKSIAYISTFSKAFPSSTIATDGNDFAYDAFRAWLAICIFPDGTGHEQYRWDANPDYLYTQYVNWMIVAHVNEVGVQKGYIPAQFAGRFFDYSSSLGTDELFVGATFSSTSGGPKSLRTALDGLAKYHRNSANGGYANVRYRQDGTIYTTSTNMTMPAAMYLGFDQTDQEFQAWFGYSASDGYLNGLQPNLQANGTAPQSLENSFGLQNAWGGHMTFQGLNVYELQGVSDANNIVMTRAQMDNLNTRLGSFDGENSGQKYYSINNGHYNYGERMWDALNAVEAAMFASGTMPGAWTYGYSGTGEINLCTGDNSMEPNPENQSTQGSLEPVYMDVAATVAATWEGRSENATINGRVKTKDQWSQELANFVFDEIVTRSADDKLDWSNGTATYRTNSTYGTNIRYRPDGFNGSYIDCWPIFQINTQGKRYINALSLIRSQIDDDPVITEPSEAGGGTKLQQVDEWLQDWVTWALVHSDYKMDTFFGSDWQTQSLPNPPNNSLYNPSSNAQNHVYYNASGTGFNEINTFHPSSLNNRHWAGIGLIKTAGLYYNNQTWKDHGEDCWQLFFKTHIFPDYSFSELYRTYYEDNGDNCPDCGINYWIVTMWEVVDVAFQHAVAVTNGVNGSGSNAGLYFDWTTSDGDQEVFTTPFVTTTTSGGQKGILNVLKEFNKYYRTPANGGYAGTRYTERNASSQNAVLDFTNWRFGQINALANTWYNDTELGLGAEMSTSTGYPGQGYYLDGSGTVAIPNWWYPFAGPFGSWRPANTYQEQTNIFSVASPPVTLLPSTGLLLTSRRRN